MTDPLISVIVPTYNRAEMLEQALERVFAQTYRNLEIIVVDDGSTDDTAGRVERYGARVRYLRQENAGPGAARNLGIEHARGSFVAFLDSDDLWLPDKIERQVALFREHPDTGMVGGGCRYVDAEGQIVGDPLLCLPEIPFEHFQIYTALPGSASNALVKKTVLDEVGGFDPSLHTAEDRDLWIRIAAGHPVRGVCEPTVLIRVHDGIRRNRGFEFKKASRMKVSGRIADPLMRRKADAWTWFLLAEHRFRERKMLRGASCLVRSFLSYPKPLTPQTQRLVPILDRVTPDWVGTTARRVVGKQRGDG